MPTETTCPSQDALRHYSLGEVRESEAAPLEAHLAGCPCCVETLHGIKEEDTLVDAMRAQSALVERPTVDDAVTRLMTVLKGWQPSVAMHPREPILARDTDPAEEMIDLFEPPQQPEELGRLGSYRILSVLGSGGMGVVFEAEDSQLRRTVALKALRPMLAASGTARKRFLREARAAAAIAHDNVVTIYQVGEDRGIPFLAMQYLAGETLEARLRRDGALPLADIIRIGRELANGLSAAHAEGLLHRDVKPANVWLETRDEGREAREENPVTPHRSSLAPRVKLLDFGLAWVADEEGPLTDHGTVVGTPGFMAPEQARGEPADVRSDLFSLGSVLYAMCTGQAPFQASSNFNTLEKVRTETPRPIDEANPAIPRWLINVVTKLHAKNPAERFQTAAEVATVLSGQQAAGSKPQTARRTPRRWWAAAAAVLLLPIVGLTLCEATGVTRLRDMVVTRREEPDLPKFVERPKKDEPKEPPVVPVIPPPPPQEQKPIQEPEEPKKGPTVYPAAIFSFDERGSGVSGQGAKVADILFAKLADREDLHLVDRSNLNAILGELELNISGVVKPNEANKIGQLTGAKLFISGSVVQIDNKVYLIAKIVGTETSKLLGVSVDGVKSDEMGPLIEKLAEKVAEKITKEADKIVPKVLARKDRIEELNKTLGKLKGAKPSVAVEISERHVGRLIEIDPAAQTEVAKYCKETGFTVTEGTSDVIFKGEAFTETLARNGKLISVKARLELKAIDRKTNEVLAVDRQTAIAVDLAEQNASKSALEEAAAILAERMLPKLVK